LPLELVNPHPAKPAGRAHPETFVGSQKSSRVLVDAKDARRLTKQRGILAIAPMPDVCLRAWRLDQSCAFAIFGTNENFRIGQTDRLGMCCADAST
jgi:hypothetical protein